MTEDEVVGWHHQFNGHKFEKALFFSKTQIPSSYITTAEAALICASVSAWTGSFPKKILYTIPANSAASIIFPPLAAMIKAPPFFVYSGGAIICCFRADYQLFCFSMKASTRSMTCGTRSMMRSTVLEAGGATLIMRTTPSLMTRKPMGSIFTPVALPPP